MRYRLRDLPAVLRTPVGRMQLLVGQMHGAWPVLWRLAALYRRVVLARKPVVVVVGSAGKTTTTRAVTVALGEPLRPGVGLNDMAFMPFIMMGFPPWIGRAVVEVGIDARGQMETFTRLTRPDICVVTTVGTDHFRSLGSIEDTRNEKVKMVKALPSDGVAILNADDENVLWMASQTNARIVTYGTRGTADVLGEQIEPNWPHGTRMRVRVQGRAYPLESPLTGRHLAYPVLAAVAAAYAEGIPIEEACRRLENLRPTPGRMQPIPLANGATLLCDYSTSTLETVEAALQSLQELSAGRRIVVLGDLTEVPGSPGPIYRRMGALLAESVDVAVLFGRDTQPYRTGATRAGMPRESIFEVGRNIREAIEVLSRELRSGDAVLLKARGHQRFNRIAMALSGRDVHCELPVCRAIPTACETCAMAERGWEGLRPIF